MDCIAEIRNIIPVKSELALAWLGQAGFLVKDCQGTTIVIDPYLSDYCEKLVGFKRLSPAVIKPENLKTDFLLLSHNHPDHLDAEAVPAIMSDSETLLVGPDSVIKDAIALGVDKSRMVKLNRGEGMEIRGIQIESVFADHGELAPDAAGFLLTVDGVRIYFAGDTSYCPDKLADAIRFKPDIIIPPINGAYGNLNEEEAAMLTRDTGAKISIPCHFWTFREHGGNPQVYFEAMTKYAPDSLPLFLTPGEIYIHRGLYHEH